MNAALVARIAQVEEEIQAIERRPGRRTGRERAQIAELSIRLGALQEALELVASGEA